MAQHTFIENVHRNTEDWLATKAAVRTKGVDCPDSTPTAQVAGKIAEIETGITPTGTIDITENGTDIDVARYAKANVNVNTADVGYMMMIKRNKLNAMRYSILPTNEYRVDDNINQIGNYAFAALGFCETIDLSNINRLGAIGDYAFFAGIQSGDAYRTSYLRSVIFPKDIVNYASIGRNAFEGCINLTTLDLRGYYTIGSHCFANSGITTLYFSTNLNFEQEAFNDANSLTDIYYEGTQTQWESITGLSDAGIPAGVTIHYNYTDDGSEL